MAFFTVTVPSGIPKYAATGFCPPIPPASWACGPVAPEKIPTSKTPEISLIVFDSVSTTQASAGLVPSVKGITSDGSRSGGKGASTIKKPWSVFSGPAFSIVLVRIVGLMLPSFFNSLRTRYTAIGATSMGIDFHAVNRRGLSFRESIAIICQPRILSYPIQCFSQLRTCNTYKFFRLQCHKLLLEQTSSSALYAVQVIIYLVCSVKCHVQHYSLGQRVKFDGCQPR